MTTDLTTEIELLQTAVTVLHGKLAPGSAYTPEQAASFGQVSLTLRDLSRVAQARTPAVAVDPEPRPTYDPTTHIEDDNPDQFEDENEA